MNSDLSLVRLKLGKKSECPGGYDLLSPIETKF
jgi:hypothetical protein